VEKLRKIIAKWKTQTKLRETEHGPSSNKDLSLPRSSDNILYASSSATWRKCSKLGNKKKLRRRRGRRKKQYTYG
jgi:hypothetical protein